MSYWPIGGGGGAGSGGGKGVLGITIDGGTTVISVGQKGYISVPYAGTITGWDIVADQTGSVSMDVAKRAAAVPNTTTDTISGASPIALSSGQLTQGGPVAGWSTVAVAAGDVIGFNVTAAAQLHRVTAQLSITKS